MRRLLAALAVVTFVAGVAEPSPAVAAAPAARCDQYKPLFQRHGLPVAMFTRIAWRESGCRASSFVRDSDDLGGGLLGINLRGRLGSTWRRWCGATPANITSAEVNVRCAAVAYRKMGLRPWR